MRMQLWRQWLNYGNERTHFRTHCWWIYNSISSGTLFFYYIITNEIRFSFQLKTITQRPVNFIMAFMTSCHWFLPSRWREDRFLNDVHAVGGPISGRIFNCFWKSIPVGTLFSDQSQLNYLHMKPTAWWQRHRLLTGYYISSWQCFGSFN